MLCWFILLGVALCLVLLLWVLQPYRNWKKNFDLRQYEPVSLINTKREVMSLKQFLEIEERHI